MCCYAPWLEQRAEQIQEAELAHLEEDEKVVSPLCGSAAGPSHGKVVPQYTCDSLLSRCSPSDRSPSLRFTQYTAACVLVRLIFLSSASPGRNTGDRNDERYDTRNTAQRTSSIYVRPPLKDHLHEAGRMASTLSHAHCRPPSSPTCLR